MVIDVVIVAFVFFNDGRTFVQFFKNDVNRPINPRLGTNDAMTEGPQSDYSAFD